METVVEAPFLETIGLLLTYRCPVACSHCLVGAGPQRQEEVALEDALDWVAQISAYRSRHIRTLSLTGGEPFFCFDKLKRIVEFGVESGIAVTVVTNAYWAGSVEKATPILKALKGLNGIRISVDVYHQKEIPFERVRNAILAARDCGLPCRVMMAVEDESSPQQSALRTLLDEVLAPEHIEIVSTIRAGRAEAQIDFSRHAVSEATSRDRCPQVGTPAILPDGQIVACCGALLALKNHHPLVLGNLREESLEDILERAERNPIIHTLRLWGPKKLVSMIEQSELKSELPKNYLEKTFCDPCYRIMSNPKLVEWLEQFAKRPGFQQAVAHGRAYHFNETEMLRTCLGW